MALEGRSHLFVHAKDNSGFGCEAHASATASSIMRATGSGRSAKDAQVALLPLNRACESAWWQLCAWLGVELQAKTKSIP